MKKFLLIICLVLVSTFSYARRVAKFMTRLQVGMTTEEVVKIMGEPESVSTINSCVYYNYLDSRMDPIVMYIHETWYYVRFINGKVDSFGREGDFDSTKDPKETIDINITQQPSVKQNETPVVKEDAYEKLSTLKKMLDADLITEDEYNAKKGELLENL